MQRRGQSRNDINHRNKNEKEKNNDTEDNDEMEVENYGDEDENENIENSVEFETMGTENEMKSTFKDSGRLNVMEKKLSDEENDIKKLIEKCEKIIGYNTENNFKIIEKAIDSVKIFKNELSKFKKTKSNTGLVKRTDFTFIVACLLLHDLIKSGFIMQT